MAAIWPVSGQPWAGYRAIRGYPGLAGHTGGYRLPGRIGAITERPGRGRKGHSERSAVIQ